MAMCLHCEEKESNRPRGLCAKCHGNKSVRRLYRWVVHADTNEETMEEIDRMIAEQMECLPDWWPEQGEVDYG